MSFMCGTSVALTAVPMVNGYAFCLSTISCQPTTDLRRYRPIADLLAVCNHAHHVTLWSTVICALNFRSIYDHMKGKPIRRCHRVLIQTQIWRSYF